MITYHTAEQFNYRLVPESWYGNPGYRQFYRAKPDTVTLNQGLLSTTRLSFLSILTVIGSVASIGTAVLALLKRWPRL